MLATLALLASALAAPTLSTDPIVLAGKTGPVKVVPVYHGTVRIEGAGKVIWVDPWSKGKLDGPKADLLFLTDVHPDHLDEAAIAAVRKEGTQIVAPQAVASAAPALKPQTLMANGAVLDAQGVRVQAVAMYNLVRGPKAGALFHDPGRGNGYLLTVDGRTIYLAGDTECTPEMKALKGVDLALIPMNLPYTMTPEEAAACVAAFQPKQVVPYHYAGSDLSVFQAALAGQKGVEVLLHDAYPGGLPW